MMENTDISKFRRDYLLTELNESNVKKNPFDQFEVWMEEAIKANLVDPSAMILATANKNAVPSVRVVLLKGIDKEGLIFLQIMKAERGKISLKIPRHLCFSFGKNLKDK